MARRKKQAGRGWVVKLGLLLLVIGAAAAIWKWNEDRDWRPSEEEFPDQGALVGEDDEAVDFEVLEGLGASFVYLEASKGARDKDADFSDNLAMAREAGLQVGAVHEFDPCVTADGQSANFVTIVPRDGQLLPPAIRLERTADECPERVSDAAVQSELLTLVNQIEAHTGSPVILSPSESFEERYRPAARLERALWLEGDLDQPDYAGRPWTIWTANATHRSEAAATPLRWLVVRP